MIRRDPEALRFFCEHAFAGLCLAQQLDRS